jgi:hypothetical protein
MLVYCVFFRIPSVILPDIPPLVSCSSVHPVSELVIYEMYLFGIGAGMEHHNVPPIRATTLVQYFSSLIGKDFRIILQAAPFVLFKFMKTSDIAIWTSLCHLGGLIFQSHVENMSTYISDLKNHINIFLSHVIEDSAQCNKAKFHMLLHLPESILQFGPASLFATEKFEL